MTFAHLVAPAAAVYPGLVGAAAATPLDAPTPCTDWDLRGLLGHLRYWTPVLAAVGRREAPAASDGTGAAALVTDDWAVRLDADRAALVEVWSDPGTWDGTVTMGGPDPLPAAMIGGMVLGELVVHGWDLGRTAGVAPAWPDDVLDGTLHAVAAMAEQGRGMGVFADPVGVPQDVPVLDRIVAVTGRDPAWTPAARGVAGGGS
ncbi:TIGR03086 family metal-binding protein [Pseudonocardia nematodicida]|uniref:TIGR03086 family metal-binding protein n=1 Tax=Pseudonocardia nematodicida TaxID=1206997 RepID=A0ABV1KF03_9PSEU